MEGEGREWSVGGRNWLQLGVEEDGDEGISGPLAIEPPGSEAAFLCRMEVRARPDSRRSGRPQDVPTPIGNL